MSQNIIENIFKTTKFYRNSFAYKIFLGMLIKNPHKFLDLIFPAVFLKVWQDRSWLGTGIHIKECQCHSKTIGMYFTKIHCKNAYLTQLWTCPKFDTGTFKIINFIPKRRKCSKYLNVVNKNLSPNRLLKTRL